MSSSLDSSKTLCAIGALMLFISFVPVIGIVGMILLYIGLKGYSEYYRDPSIASRAFKGLIFGIIAMITFSAFSLTSMFSWFTVAGIFNPLAAIGSIIIFVGLIGLAFVFYLLMAINLRPVFETLAQRSGENMFRTAGTIMFWGAVLTIVLFGFVLIWISWLILALAFFSMKTQPQQPTSYQQPAAAPKMQNSYCPHCGAPVDASATFCPHCGKQLNQP